MKFMHIRFWLLLVVLLLGGCVSGSSGQYNSESTETDQQRLQSRIAWLLLEADEAVNRQQLTTPEGDNAWARYRDVLKLQPANIEAQRGLDRIVNSYLRWARQAAKRGDTQKAQKYLDRARLVQPDSQKIKQLQSQLSSYEVERGDAGTLAIDLQRLAARDQRLSDELADMGQQVQQQGAIFLIVAPNDRDARWIHQSMQKSVSERLRGNIEIGTRARIEVLPKP